LCDASSEEPQSSSPLHPFVLSTKPIMDHPDMDSNYHILYFVNFWSIQWFSYITGINRDKNIFRLNRKKSLERSGWMMRDRVKALGHRIIQTFDQEIALKNFSVDLLPTHGIQCFWSHNDIYFSALTSQSEPSPFFRGGNWEYLWLNLLMHSICFFFSW
jgi:hypothetical protein